MKNYIASGPSPQITTDDVAKFRAYVKKGMKLRCMDYDYCDMGAGALEKPNECKVLRKYPYCCLTTKGCYGWNMLTIWNRDVLLEARRYATWTA